MNNEIQARTHRWFKWGGVWEVAQLDQRSDPGKPRWNLSGSLVWVFEDDVNIEEWGEFITCPYLDEQSES